MWINQKSWELIRTDDARVFTEKNNLNSNGDSFVSNFYNEKILVKVYEERGYLHADYYDLKNMKWARDLDAIVVSQKIESVADRVSLLKSFDDTDDILKGELMQRFRFYLVTIDRYMQDFLAGNTDQYNQYLISLEGDHKLEIEAFKKKYTLTSGYEESK